MVFLQSIRFCIRVLFPGQYDEQTNRGAGVYAVPVHVAGLPLNYLIPLTYNVPT